MALPPPETLSCPDCGPRAPLQAGAEPEGIFCPSCGRRFPLLNGVLDVAPKETALETRETVDQFGASWTSHEYLAPYQERQFLDWIAPLEAGAFQSVHDLFVRQDAFGLTAFKQFGDPGRFGFYVAQATPSFLLHS